MNELIVLSGERKARRPFYLSSILCMTYARTCRLSPRENRDIARRKIDHRRSRGVRNSAPRNLRNGDRELSLVLFGRNAMKSVCSNRSYRSKRKKERIRVGEHFRAGVIYPRYRQQAAASRGALKLYPSGSENIICVTAVAFFWWVASGESESSRPAPDVE